uniref:NADH-ubiquinone oxidoreductase chain 2 n=1 Tax=Megalinus hunanensis TaxID=2820342 RepID=A0A8A4YR07_9COLE|nr:NADH dehydrogenase subunit 2 [Megalinus hunanensis]QTE20680.1 NADH dehydrogenase subunit 2 [Megalinus hunanensis]
MIKIYKMMFLFTTMFGTLISISSFSWMGMWMGLEINLLAIIPLMNNSDNNFSSEASLKYFISQALASTIFLFSLILISNNFIIMNISNYLILMLNSSLLIKMGSAPFHFWFPEVMEGLSWMNCMLLLTWQKIAPMILLMYNLNFPMFFMLIIVLSMLVSGIMGFNQTSLRKIIAFSSINHIAWMLSSMFIMETIWLHYFIIYFIISINIIIIFYANNIFYLKQLFVSFNKNFMIKLFFILNFLSLGGLPPFLGFFPKWITIQNLVENNFIMLSLIMIILTLIILYYYMRITFSSLMINLNELNYNFNYSNSNNLIFCINFISLSGLLFSTLMFNYL